MAQLALPQVNGKVKKLVTQQSVNSAVKTICDIMRRSNVAGALQYVPELTWILFLRILDERETREADEAEAVGLQYTPSLVAPYRWQDWAAPNGPKRVELQNGALGAFFAFVNGGVNADGTRFGLLPYLKALKDQPNATPRQKVISEILSGVERVRIDTEKNFLDVLDKVHELSTDNVDPTHVFMLSQVYEGLLLKMGEKGNDGGQFFTPREVIRLMVQVIAPRIGETVYDPGCGTGGFLAQAYEQMRAALGDEATADELEALKRRTFYGREKENLIYPIALANLMLHGIDQPNLWHGNTLTGGETYGGLFAGAPAQFDVILTNPPFGGKEGKEAQTNFAYKTGATQVLFLQHVIDKLKRGGRCGIVLDEGVLFRTNETAFVQTKRKLLDECDLYCIVSLPGGVFTAAGAGVKTNLLFFNKGKGTERIWYYDLSDLKVGKTTPLTIDKFADFLRLFPGRVDSDRSWTVDLTDRKQVAREKATRLQAQSKKLVAEAGELTEQIDDLSRKQRGTQVEKVSNLVAQIQQVTEQRDGKLKEARKLNGEAEAVLDAVYDLKAVNPNAKTVQDTRTPEELIGVIEAKGREVSEALAVLKAL